MAYQSPFHSQRTPAPDQATRDRMRAALDQRVAESKAKGYGPAKFDYLKKLGEDINRNIHASEGDKQKKGPTESQVRKAAKEGKVLYASAPSVCFTELSWQDGLATFTFAKGGGDGTYSIEMDVEDFMAWASDDLGRTYNDVWKGAEL